MLISCVTFLTVKNKRKRKKKKKEKKEKERKRDGWHFFILTFSKRIPSQTKSKPNQNAKFKHSLVRKEPKQKPTYFKNHFFRGLDSPLRFY